MMQIEMPAFCDNCMQSEKFNGSKYCRRCIEMAAIAERPLSAHPIIVAFSVILIVAAFVALLIMR